MNCRICGDELIDLTVGDEAEPSWHHAQGRHDHIPVPDEKEMSAMDRQEISEAFERFFERQGMTRIEPK